MIPGVTHLVCKQSSLITSSICLMSVYSLIIPSCLMADISMYQDTEKDLEKLVVYCRSISIKPWSWSKQRETSVSEMFSFGEPTAMKLCKHSPQGDDSNCHGTLCDGFFLPHQRCLPAQRDSWYVPIPKEQDLTPPTMTPP